MSWQFAAATLNGTVRIVECFTKFNSYNLVIVCMAMEYCYYQRDLSSTMQYCLTSVHVVYKKG